MLNMQHRASPLVGSTCYLPHIRAYVRLYQCEVFVNYGLYRVLIFEDFVGLSSLQKNQQR